MAASLGAAFIGKGTRFGAGGRKHERGCALGGRLTKPELTYRRNLNPCADLGASSGQLQRLDRWVERRSNRMKFLIQVLQEAAEVAENTIW